jgi:hypothetical protein
VPWFLALRILAFFSAPSQKIGRELEASTVGSDCKRKPERSEGSPLRLCGRVTKDVLRGYAVEFGTKKGGNECVSYYPADLLQWQHP